jgi:inosose dehydratase
MPDECVRLGKLLTELGKRVSDVGVKLGYHNHMNTISEHPENLQRVMDASDPRYVGLELDTAHYVAGGGDPAEAILHYRDRLLFLHLKDVVDLPVDTPGVKYPFKFVELGRGRVNLPAVMNAVRKTNFNGWAIVELDKVPDKSRTPKECAEISKQYLQNQLHVTV